MYAREIEGVCAFYSQMMSSGEMLAFRPFVKQVTICLISKEMRVVYPWEVYEFPSGVFGSAQLTSPFECT